MLYKMAARAPYVSLPTEFWYNRNAESIIPGVVYRWRLAEPAEPQVINLVLDDNLDNAIKINELGKDGDRVVIMHK